MPRSAPFDWTDEALSLVASLRRAGKTHDQVAEELSRKYGRPVTAGAVRHGMASDRYHELSRPLAATAPPTKANPAATSAQPPAPPEDAFTVEQIEELIGEEPPEHFEPLPVPEMPAPFIQTSKTRGESYLIIPDTQDPYSARAWLDLARAVVREFDVDATTPGRVLHCGDEADQYHASRFDKDPDHEHTATLELQAYRERVKEIGAAFPHMWFPRSNHGDRWMKKAFSAQIPSQLVRAWREVIQAPEGWRWEKNYRIKGSKEEFLLEHGDHGAQGLNGTRQRVLDNGCSTVHGHQHATAAVVYVATTGRPRPQWGFNCACLIDVEAKAFDYGRSSRFQPTVGIGVILDGGRMPLWIPYGGSWP